MRSVRASLKTALRAGDNPLASLIVLYPTIMIVIFDQWEDSLHMPSLHTYIILMGHLSIQLPCNRWNMEVESLGGRNTRFEKGGRGVGKVIVTNKLSLKSYCDCKKLDLSLHHSILRFLLWKSKMTLGQYQFWEGLEGFLISSCFYVFSWWCLLMGLPVVGVQHEGPLVTGAPGHGGTPCASRVGSSIGWSGLAAGGGHCAPPAWSPDQLSSPSLQSTQQSLGLEPLATHSFKSMIGISDKAIICILHNNLATYSCFIPPFIEWICGHVAT